MSRRKNRPRAGQQTGNAGDPGTPSAGQRTGKTRDPTSKFLLAVFLVVASAMGFSTHLCSSVREVTTALNVDVNSLRTSRDKMQKANKALNVDVNNLRTSLDEMRRSADAAVRDAKLSIKREIDHKLAEAKGDVNSVTDSAIEKLRKEIERIQYQSANGLTVLRELSASSPAPASRDTRSAENAKYHVTIYYNRQTEGLFEACRRRLQEAGFLVNGLDKTRALAIVEQLKSPDGAPKWSLNEIGANAITATGDALPKARQVSDLLGKAGIDVGKEVLDWEQFRSRYGDSMLTKAFPNARGLIEIYLLVAAGNVQP